MYVFKNLVMHCGIPSEQLAGLKPDCPGPLILDSIVYNSLWLHLRW